MSRSGSRIPIAAIALLCFAPCYGSVAGGSGEGITPYGSWEKVDAARVKVEQRKSNQVREAKCDANPELRFVTGFAQVRSDSTRGPLSPFLVGWTGAKRSKIQLSQIAEIVVKARDAANGRVQCEVTVFPNVTPESLVQTKPDYMTLAAKRTVKMTIWIRDAGELGRMAIVGRSAVSPAAPEKRVAFEDMPVGAVVRFHGRDITMPSNYWWAIHSVYEDPKFPYRREQSAE